MSKKLGVALKIIRTRRHLSQKDVAKGICKQSILMSIEEGEYMPDGHLMLLLCERLSINLSRVRLAKNYKISTSEGFNDILFRLYNKRDYAGVEYFLSKAEVIDKVKTAKQIQAYYYYLSLANLHIKSHFTNAERNLRLSISSDEAPRTRTTLTRLGLITLSFVQAKKGQAKQVPSLILNATKNLDKCNYKENLNLVFYLAALSNYKINQTLDSIKWAKKGIDYTTMHHSNYMLVNLYQLLAQATEDKSFIENLEVRNWYDRRSMTR